MITGEQGDTCFSNSNSCRRRCILACRSSARRCALIEFNFALGFPAASFSFKSAARKSQYWISQVSRSLTAFAILSAICCLCALTSP